MGCKFPEHHGSSGGANIGEVLTVFFLAAIAFAIFGPFLHLILLAAGCLLLGAAAGGGLIMRRRLREYRAVTQGRYVPFMQPAQQRAQFQAQQQPAVSQGGQHLHLHLGDLTPAERAAAIRQIRGG